MNGVDEVAVKVAKKAAPTRRELEFFISEVSLLSRLHHRNIVQVGTGRGGWHVTLGVAGMDPAHQESTGQ